MSLQYTSHLYVDFNAVDANGEVPGTTRYCKGPKPKVGDTVLLDDTDGLTVRGRVTFAEGNLLRAAPDWRMMRSQRLTMHTTG